MQIKIINDNSTVAYFRFGGSDDPAPDGTYNGAPLDGSDSFAIPAYGTLDGIDLTQFTSGKFLFSLGSTLPGLPDFQENGGTGWTVPWDKTELTLYSDPSSDSTINLSSTDFYGLDLTVQTYATTDFTTPVTTLGYTMSTQALMGELAALANYNPMVVVTGTGGVDVNGEDVLRVISPSSVPPDALSAYHSWTTYITSEEGQFTEVKGLYTNTVTTPPDMAQQYYDFVATILSNGDMQMVGGGTSYNGGPTIGSGWTIDIAADQLSADIYQVNPSYTVTDSMGNVTNVPSTQNDVFDAAIRDYLSGFDYGFVGSTAIDPNTGVALGSESTDNWYNTGTIEHAPLTSAHAFAYANSNVLYYNQYAADVMAAGDSYGFPYTDLIGEPLANIDPNTVGSITITIDDIACFAEGTRIRTARGDVAVEDFEVGDLVVTAAGRGEKPIVWLGHRRVDCRRHPKPASVWPVRVTAGALGDGLPARDLWLSPDHSVFMDGVLIPIRYLVNGRTVRQEPRDAVRYFHVELAAHDILLAEGLPCESFLDTGNRSDFDNGGATTRMHPEFALQAWASRSCAPLVLDGDELEAARSFVRWRAQALGHRTTAAPAVRLCVDGAYLSPRVSGRTYRFQVPASARHVFLASNSAVPAEIRDRSGEQRRLGIAVSALRIDAAAVALDDPRLGAGWHAIEQGEDAAWRWTDGCAELHGTAGKTLAIDVALTELYWREDTAEPLRATA